MGIRIVQSFTVSLGSAEGVRKARTISVHDDGAANGLTFMTIRNCALLYIVAPSRCQVNSCPMRGV
jgi:hypothetical protein